MSRRFYYIIVMVIAAVGLQACGMHPAPQESCNFVQNSEKQRVSWGAKTPVILYIGNSVPSSYFDPIRKATEVWNAAAGREILKIGGIVDQASNASPDGTNLISFEREWNGHRAEQARTTIYWAGSRIYESDVRLNDRDFRFFAGDSPGVSEVDMESLMIHEFGHVLGLKHTDLTQSVMQPTLAGASLDNPRAAFRRELGEVDLNSIRCEY